MYTDSYYWFRVYMMFSSLAKKVFYGYAVDEVGYNKIKAVKRRRRRFTLFRVLWTIFL